MKWTEINTPVEGYNYIFSETPLGEISIEWDLKSKTVIYDIMLDNLWVDAKFDLDTAKKTAKEHLKNKSKELIEYLIKD